MDPYGSSRENTVILVEIENTIIMKKCVNVRLSALNTLRNYSFVFNTPPNEQLPKNKFFASLPPKTWRDGRNKC